MKRAQAIETLEIAGWKVQRMLLPKGSKYYAIVTGNRTRADIGYVALWLKGCIVGRNLTTGAELEKRQPWTLSSDLSPLSVGRLEFEATEDTEWYCFDGKLNNGATPEMALLRGGEAVIPGMQAFPLADGVYLLIKPRSA